MNSFNEQKERDEQRGDEWMFGAIPVDLAEVPLTERIAYLPAGMVQFNNVFDTNGCVSRTFLNDLEEKLDYFYDKGMHLNLQKWCNENSYRINGKFALCDAYIEILSGTTPSGNSMKAPLDTIRKFGVIPAKFLPLENNMSWNEYMNPGRITKAHKDLGAEFLRRFVIGYEKVPISQFAQATTSDSLIVAVKAWSVPVDGVYPKIEGAFGHATLRISNEIDAFDTYEPFIKRLAKDYIFFEHGYSLSITMQNPYPDETLAIFEVLQKYGLLRFFVVWWKRMMKS